MIMLEFRLLMVGFGALMFIFRPLIPTFRILMCIFGLLMFIFRPLMSDFRLRIPGFRL